MVVVRGASIVLGSSMPEIIRAAEECAARAEDPPPMACAPEQFTAELSSGEAVEVPTFLLDRSEVSVAEYLQCVRARRCLNVSDSRRIAAFLSPLVPIVFVRQADAQSFCEFRGARLPTEAEFELAARGVAGRRYPWGNSFHRRRANAGRTGVRTTDESDGHEMLAPTNSFPDGVSPQGLRQLSGNAAEWTSSPFLPHKKNARTAAPSQVVVKGGSFAQAPVHLRGAARQAASPNLRSPQIGFRCARSVSPQDI
jgi:formylglycine-generating enzyme